MASPVVKGLVISLQSTSLYAGRAVPDRTSMPQKSLAFTQFAAQLIRPSPIPKQLIGRNLLFFSLVVAVLCFLVLVSTRHMLP